MIEMMLEAERAMGVGLIDNAERLYRQVVAADPHNSIAITGLARVALERGDQRGAYLHARRALALDADNPVAGHLAHRMAEQFLMRGEPLPEEPIDEPSGAPGATAPNAAERNGSTGAAHGIPSPVPPATPSPGSPATPSPTSPGPSRTEPSARPGLLDRLFRRRR